MSELEQQARRIDDIRPSTEAERQERQKQRVSRMREHFSIPENITDEAIAEKEGDIHQILVKAVSITEGERASVDNQVLADIEKLLEVGDDSAYDRLLSHIAQYHQTTDAKDMSQLDQVFQQEIVSLFS